MKKLLAIILALLVVLSLAACSSNSDTASSDPSGSNPSSSKPKPLGSAVTGTDSDSDSADTSGDGTVIEFKSVAKGYINHSNIYIDEIVNFNGFECMDKEYLFIPKGTTIMSENTCAIFCYKYEEGDGLVLDIEACKNTGCVIAPSGWSLQHSAGTYQTTTDVYARISVKGSLKDVGIYPQKDQIENLRLLTEEELIAELSK